jgi:hypothetical protein
LTVPAPYLDPLTSAARDWYDAGYAVIPCHEDGGKRPFGAWREYQVERPTWEQVEAWLATGRYSGIGVLTGATSGNVEMIEIEGPIGNAVERLQRVIAAAQQYADVQLPELLADVARGCVEQSAGGGLHLFIRIIDGPALGNTKLAYEDTKVVAETRGEGGFVVVAPTPGRKGHEPGTAYLFINGGRPTKTVKVTVEDRDLLHLLFTLALDDGSHTTTPDAQPRTHSPGTETHIRDIPQPGGSTFDTYRQRATWRSILEPAGWTWSHQDADRDYWVRPGKNPNDGHSATTYEDGPFYNFSSNAPIPTYIGLSKGQVYAHLYHQGDMSAAARDLAGQGFGDHGLPTIELPPWQPADSADLTPDEVEEAKRSWVHDRLPKVDWHALWADEQEEEWIVEPLIAARRLIALYSAPKVGKSLLMLELAAGIASGRPLFGYNAQRPRRTLYVDFENDPRGDIRARLKEMGYGPGDLDNLVLLSFPTMDRLDTEKGSQELMAAVTAYECDIVVIDTVSRAIKGEENENDTWLSFYRHTGLKLKQAGVALVRLDHAGKDESKGQRGGSAKSGDVDAVWRLKRSGDDLYDLECEAQRFPITEKFLTLRRLEDPLRHEVLANPVRDKKRDIIDALTKHSIDPALPTLTAARQALRATGYSFTTKVFSEAIWEQYKAQPRTWQPITTTP